MAIETGRDDVTKELPARPRGAEADWEPPRWEPPRPVGPRRPYGNRDARKDAVPAAPPPAEETPDGTPEQADDTTVTGDVLPDVTAAAGPRTLDDVLRVLHTRYFPGNDRALGAIVARVALRTGADLHAPRPDQLADP